MEWKTIKYNDKYEVSDTGLVRTKKTGHIHSGCIAQGYLSVKLTFENSRQKRFKIHRLVAEHFIENPDPKKKTFVNHIDGNKLNNNKENLEWVTPRENSKHANEDRRKKGRTGNGGRYCLVEQYYGWNKYRVVEIGLSLSEVLKKIDEMNILARKEQRIHWCYGEVHYNKMKTQKHFKEGMWLGGITNQNGVRGYTQKSNCDC